MSMTIDAGFVIAKQGLALSPAEHELLGPINRAVMAREGLPYFAITHAYNCVSEHRGPLLIVRAGILRPEHSEEQTSINFIQQPNTGRFTDEELHVLGQLAMLRPVQDGVLIHRY